MIQEQLNNADIWQNDNGTANIDSAPYWVFCVHIFFENQAHDSNTPARQPYMMYIQELQQHIHSRMNGHFIEEERMTVNRLDLLVIGDASHMSKEDTETALNDTLRAICDDLNEKWFKPEENKLTYDFHPIQSYEKYLWTKDTYLK